MEGTMETNAFLSAPNNKKLFTLFALYIGNMAAIFVSATQSTMLPIAAQEIGGAEYYTLVSALQGVMGVVLLPLYGYLIAKNPAIKGKLMGFSLIVNACVFFSRTLAMNMWQIIIPGVLYGMIPPTIYVVGYSTIRDIYDKKKAAYYLGFCATMLSIGQLAGPVIGGLIMDNSSWRNVNHLIWPFMLFAGVLSLIGVNVKKEDVEELARNVKFDFWGAISITIFLATFTLGLSIGTSFAPFGGMLSNILFVTCVIALIAFVFSLKKMKDEAFLPLGILKDRNTLSFTACQFFTNLHTMSTIIFLPMFVLYVMGQSAMMSGLCTALYAVASLFVGPFFGKLIAKQGTAKPLYSCGTILRIILTACYVFVLKADANIYVILGIQLLSGIYNAQSNVTFSVGPQVMLKDEVRVQGNSVIQTFQTVGSTLAVAIYTFVIGAFGIDPGVRVIFILATVFAVLALISSIPMKKEDN